MFRKYSVPCVVAPCRWLQEVVETCKGTESNVCTGAGNETGVYGRQQHGMCVTLNAKYVEDELQISVHKLEIFTGKYEPKKIQHAKQKSFSFL